MEESKELLDDELQKVTGGYEQFDEGEVDSYPVGAEYRYKCTSSKDYYYVRIVKCDYFELRRTYLYIVNTWYIDRIYGTRHDSKQMNVYHGYLNGFERVK